MKTLLPALLAITLARLWLMPLPSSFWLDETGTMFVVRYGAGHPSFAIAPQVPASIYYWLPGLSSSWLGAHSAGWIEAAYRLPSVLALGLALFLLFRLANRLIAPGAGWVAVFACLALKGINYAAADARPYALGLLVSTAGAWFLVRWLDDAQWFDALGFVVAAALLWRVHLIYWPFYLVYGGYALVRFCREDTRVSGTACVGVAVIVSAALAPVAIEALALARHAGAHVIAESPTWNNLLVAMKPGLIVPLLAGAWLWRGVETRRWLARPAQSSFGALTLIGLWWVVQPLALFAFSRLTGNSVFVGRYYSLSLPGAALMATLCSGLFLPAAWWRGAAAILGVTVLAALGQWGLAWPAHHDSDWRGAALAVNRLERDPAFGERTLVICPSPFIEARPPEWTPDYPLPGFLYAHLAAYPVGADLKLLPYADSPEAEKFAGRLVADTLPAMGRFVIYGAAYNAEFWRKWFARRPELSGWTNRSVGEFGDVNVVVFEKQR